MTEENLQSSASESPEVQAAEASLDNALAALKSGKTPEPEKVEEVEEVQPEERPILRLPEKPQEKPEKKFVETDEPEVQRRINELYKDKKTAEERVTLLQDELMRIADRAEEREQFLYTELQKIQQRHDNQDEEAALSDLRRQYNEAIQDLDYDAATKINEKIVDFKTEQKINSLKLNTAVKPPVKKQNLVYSDPQDIVDANKFQGETGNDGNLLRPWLQPTHSEFQNVVDLMAAVSNGYIRKGQRPSLSAVMQQVDKYMGLGTQKGTSTQGQAPSSLKHAPVLSSNTALNASSDNKEANKLSDLERSYAAKLGVSEEKYARLRKIGSSGPISMDNFKK